MQLTVLERLTLLQSLPPEGNLSTLRIVRKLREALSFTEEEHKQFGIRQVGDQVLWSLATTQEADIPIGEKATDIVVQALKGLDKQQKLTENHLSLWDKFVGEG